jgi:hypothetical protein
LRRLREFNKLLRTKRTQGKTGKRFFARGTNCKKNRRQAYDIDQDKANRPYKNASLNVEKMMSSRREFNFYLAGVNSRGIALFTSYVRVLDFRLQHRWCYQIEGAHLIIYGEVQATEQSIDVKENSPYELFLSANESGDNFLRLPLSSSEIEVALNRVGNMLSKRGSEEIFLDSSTWYRLLRWPPIDMLKTPSHIRLSTIMTKRIFTIDELHKRSGLELSLCRQFVENMFLNGLLEDSTSQQQQQKSQHFQSKNGHANAEKTSARSKILSLIRSNLARFSKS